MIAPIDREDAAVPNGILAVGLKSVWVRRAGMIFGLAMLAAAVWMICRQHEVLSKAVQSIQHTSPERLGGGAAILIGSVLANIVLTGMLFSLLMSRYGRVGGMEMQALIASATLMNYLPLRPGFFGRLAYHKACNDIPLRSSVKTVLQAMALSAVVAGWLAVGIAVSVRWQFSPWLFAIAPPFALLLCGAMISTLRIRLWSAAIRFAEVLVIAMRYLAAFALIGSPIDSRAALGFACISVMASMVPFLSNGLGLREWAVGLTAPLLASSKMELGITADLMNRAAEIAVALPAGLIGMAVLMRYRMRRTGTR